MNDKLERANQSRCFRFSTSSFNLLDPPTHFNLNLSFVYTHTQTYTNTYVNVNANACQRTLSPKATFAVAASDWS